VDVDVEVPVLVPHFTRGYPGLITRPVSTDHPLIRPKEVARIEVVLTDDADFRRSVGVHIGDNRVVVTGKRLTGNRGRKRSVPFDNIEIGLVAVDNLRRAVVVEVEYGSTCVSRRLLVDGNPPEEVQIFIEGVKVFARHERNVHFAVAVEVGEVESSRTVLPVIAGPVYLARILFDIPIKYGCLSVIGSTGHQYIEKAVLIKVGNTRLAVDKFVTVEVEEFRIPLVLVGETRQVIVL